MIVFAFLCGGTTAWAAETLAVLAPGHLDTQLWRGVSRANPLKSAPVFDDELKPGADLSGTPGAPALSGLVLRQAIDLTRGPVTIQIDGYRGGSFSFWSADYVEKGKAPDYTSMYSAGYAPPGSKPVQLVFSYGESGAKGIYAIQEWVDGQPIPQRKGWDRVALPKTRVYVYFRFAAKQWPEQVSVLQGPFTGPSSPPPASATKAQATVAQKGAAASANAAPPSLPPPGGGAPGAPAPRPPTAAMQSAQAAIDAIVDAASGDDIIRATRTVVQMAGMQIDDGQRASAPAPPPGGLTLDALRLRAVAFDEHNRAEFSRMTLAELGTSLQQLGVPLRDDIPPGLALERFLADWTNAALTEPSLGAAAPALLFAASARRQEPPIDVRYADYAPDALRLGFLDLDLLFAGLAQMTPVFADALPAQGAGAPTQLAGLWNALGDMLSPTAYAADPCSALAEKLNEWVPQWASPSALSGGALSLGAKAAIGKLAGAISQLVPSVAGNSAQIASATAGAFARLFSGFGLIMKLQAAYTLYHDSTVNVKIIGDNPVHRPLGGPRFVAAKVTAGIPDELWAKESGDHNSTLDLLKGCARLLGLPVPTDERDIAKQINNWHVKWIVDGGAGGVELGVDPATFDTRLTVSVADPDPHQGSNTLPLKLVPENKADHPGDLITDTAYVTAKVRTDQPPTLATFVTFGIGVITGNPVALVAALADPLLAIWEHFDTLDATKLLRITHHTFVPGVWHGVITVTTSGDTDASGPQETFPPNSRSWSTNHGELTEKRIDQLTITGTKMDTPGNVVLSARDALSAEADFSSSSASGTRAGDGDDCSGDQESTSAWHAVGGGSGDGQVSIAIVDGQYEIDFDTAAGTIKGHSNQHQEYHSSPGCVNIQTGEGQDSQDISEAMQRDLDGSSFSVTGPLASQSSVRLPDHIAGSRTESGAGDFGAVTITYQWDLVREPKPGPWLPPPPVGPGGNSGAIEAASE